MIKNIKELKSVVDNLVNSNDLVLISPHIKLDCDALASALSMYFIVKKIGKKAYIVIDDNLYKLDHTVLTLLESLPKSISIVKVQNALKNIQGKKTLLITTDTNKTNLVPFDDFKIFTDVLLIDHHDVGDTTIKTDYKYIDTKVSSASEIMFNLINSYGIKIDDKNDETVLLANFLLSGIALDTAKFAKINDRMTKTWKVISKLNEKGASMEFVNDLFRSDNESALKVHDLVSKTDINMINFAITLDKENPDNIFNVEELAKAADFLIDLKGMDLAFALGYIEAGLVGISARSKGEIDVGEIMRQFGGGGNFKQAAARVESEDIKEVKLKLESVIKPGYNLR